VKLSEIQSEVVSYLTGAAALAGLTVIADDGTYPKTPQREQAMREKGILMVVWNPQADAVTDQVIGAESYGMFSTKVHIVVEENAARSRLSVENGGAGMTGLAVVEEVISAVVGRDGGVNENNGFTLSDPPFTDFGADEGLRRFVVHFDKTVSFKST
jgi:hypothetical protein